MTVRPGRSAGMDGAGSAGETRSLNRHSAQRGSRLWLVASRRPTRLSPRREVAPLGSLTTTALAQPSSSFCRGSSCGPLWGGASSCVRRGSVASSRWTTASMAPPVASVGDLHRHAGLPGLVLVGVVQVRARRGRRVLAGHESTRESASLAWTTTSTPRLSWRRNRRGASSRPCRPSAVWPRSLP